MSVIFDGKDRGKKHSKLVFVGHRDHGKSSMLGRLFYDTGSVDEKVMERIRVMAKEMGREGFEYAFVMDQIKEERMRGITIGLAHKKLLADGVSFTFADAPGHKDFIKNMLVGASESEASILVIAADEGVREQTKQHLYLSRMLGVPGVLVAVNKMDKVGYSEEKFREIEKQATELVKKTGYHVNEVPIIPCSALEGDNVVRKTEKMPWYEGPTFLELIKNLPQRKVPKDLPLRMPVQDIYEIDGERVVIGRIETGILKTGDEIHVMPGGIKFRVRRMFIRNDEVRKAGPGDNLYLYLDENVRGSMRRGSMIGKVGQTKPRIVNGFEAQVMVLNSPVTIKGGHECEFELMTENSRCIIGKLLKRVDTCTGEMEDGPPEIKEGESAMVWIETEKPVYIETQSEIPQLSSFRLQEAGRNVAMGICTGGRHPIKKRKI